MKHHGHSGDHAFRLEERTDAAGKRFWTCPVCSKVRHNLRRAQKHLKLCVKNNHGPNAIALPDDIIRVDNDAGAAAGADAAEVPQQPRSDDRGPAPSATVPPSPELRGRGRASPPAAAQPSVTAGDRWANIAENVRAGHLHARFADPWAEHHLEREPTERAIRHVYDPLAPRGERWRSAGVLVKMGRAPFAAGAMRECFRMRKSAPLLSFQHDWTKQSNYVAKAYKPAMLPREDDDDEGGGENENDNEAGGLRFGVAEWPEDVAPSREKALYVTDVVMQMECKRLGDRFNRREPPHRIDFIFTWLLELVDRPGRPLRCVERFIPGDYVKWNTNSGFVEHDHGPQHAARRTPQAFSHFSFEATRRRAMVVDIQGVGDLFTDPQLHTAGGLDYGAGNLGPRGFALFFSTHRPS